MFIWGLQIYPNFYRRNALTKAPPSVNLCVICFHVLFLAGMYWFTILEPFPIEHKKNVNKKSERRDTPIRKISCFNLFKIFVNLRSIAPLHLCYISIGMSFFLMEKQTVLVTMLRLHITVSLCL